MNNVFLSFSNGHNILIYTELSCATCQIWAEKALGVRVEDAYCISQNDLQYYCIDERLWNTPEEDKRVLEYIKTQS